MRRAKRRAAADGRSLTALIEDGVRRVLRDGGRAGFGKRVLPPVSRAVGGLLPGIDLDDSAELADAEDIQFAGRDA